MSTPSAAPPSRLRWPWGLAALFALAGWPGYFLIRGYASEAPGSGQPFMGSFTFGLVFFSALSALPFVILALLSSVSWVSAASARAAAWSGGVVGVLCWGLFTVLNAAQATTPGESFGWIALVIAFGSLALVTAVVLLTLALGLVAGPRRTSPE